MYPKVKVREQEGDDHKGNFFDAFESLSMQEFNSDVNGWEDDTPASVVRIPNSSHLSNSTVPMISVSKETRKRNNHGQVVKDNKPNMKASSILRPRAVLSSPDNDGMIGSRNMMKTELMSGLKNHNLCQNRHTQCKVNPSPVVFGSPTSTRREFKEVASAKADPKGKRGPLMSDRSQRAHLGKEKPRPIQI